jgi:hypothetical protein
MIFPQCCAVILFLLIISGFDFKNILKSEIICSSCFEEKFKSNMPILVLYESMVFIKE